MAIQQLWEYPPKPFLEQIVRHCPKAAETYFFLWENKDKNNRLILTKDDVAFKHPVAFKDDLRKLSNEGLINFRENAGAIGVEVVDWEEEFDD